MMGSLLLIAVGVVLFLAGLIFGVGPLIDPYGLDRWEQWLANQWQLLGLASIGVACIVEGRSRRRKKKGAAAEST